MKCYSLIAGSGRSIDQCFTALNVQGEGFGNCGYSGGTFIACSLQNALCGQLHCNSGQFTGNARVAGTIFERFVSGSRCLSFTTSPQSDTPNPALVSDGSKCGNESVGV